MKTYLLGVSVYAQKLFAGDVLNGYRIDGLFDNNALKWGMEEFGLKIEKPYYSPEIEIIITVNPSYHIEIIAQLLELGYSKFIIFLRKEEGVYEKVIYDYSRKDYQYDRENLVLLYLEHRSYSGICAIDYMCRNHLVNMYSFRVVLLENGPKEPEDYYHLAAAKYVITERSWNHNYKIKAKVIQLWHGFPLKAMGHMLAQYDEGRYGYLDGFWRKFDYILSYGLNYTTFLTACYATFSEQYTVTGMPRNDLLFLAEGRKNLADKMPGSIGRRIVLYMPTFRAIMEKEITANGNEEGYLFYWKDFDADKLEEFCKKENIFFVFKLHPSDASKVAKLEIRSEHIAVLTDEMLDEKCMYEFLNAADVLVTDYSSVYFDYLLLNRPVIFTDNDVESYAGNRGFMLEPLDFWRPGAVVHTFDGFLESVEKSLDGEDEYRQARENLMPFVHQYRDAGATQRLFDLLKADYEGKRDKSN